MQGSLGLEVPAICHDLLTTAACAVACAQGAAGVICHAAQGFLSPQPAVGGKQVRGSQPWLPWRAEDDRGVPERDSERWDAAPDSGP